MNDPSVDTFVLLVYTLVGWTRVRPATRDPWSYDHHDPATRVAEREGIDRLVAGGR